MPDLKAPSRGRGIQVIWISKDHRAVVDFDLLESALALKLAPGKVVQLWAVTGDRKQIQILPPESELAQLRESYEQMGPSQLRWHETDNDKADVRRRLEAFFRITCRARTQSKSFRFTLPWQAFDLDLLRINESLVLSVVGNIVELWRRDRWNDLAAIEDLTAFTERLRDIIGDDE